MEKPLLKTVSVKDLFGTYDYSVCLNEDLTLIHGLNGCGKSTLMKMMAALINGHYDKLHQVMFSEFFLDFSDGTVITVDKDIKSVRKAEQELQSLWKEYLNMDWNPDESEKSIEQERLLNEADHKRKELILRQKIRIGIHKNQREIGQYEFCCHVPEDQDRVQRCKTAIADVLGVTRVMILDSNRLFQKDQEGKLMPKIPSLADELQKEIHHLLELPRHFVSQEQQNELLDMHMAIPTRDAIPPIVSEWDPVYELYLKIRRFFTTLVKDFQIPNKYLFLNLDHMITVWTAHGCSIPLSSLSTGEKNLFVLFYEIIFRCDENTIVLIDEPENSLHISWQMAFVNVLLKLLQERGYQAIVTTHSPNIINDHWDITLGLGEDEDGDDENESE